MSYLNELGTVLEMEKHYFDSQSKIILSFKSVQAALLQQCLDECKHLSLHEIASLIQPSSSHSKIITLNPEDLRMPGARIIYDLLYVLQHPLHPDQSILIHIEAQGRNPISIIFLAEAFISLPVNKTIPWDFRMNLTMISWMFAPCGFVCAMRKRKTTVGWNIQQ